MHAYRRYPNTRLNTHFCYFKLEVFAEECMHESSLERGI